MVKVRYCLAAVLLPAVLFSGTSARPQGQAVPTPSPSAMQRELDEVNRLLRQRQERPTPAPPQPVRAGTARCAPLRRSRGRDGS